jgi:hypothetical protein
MKKVDLGGEGLKGNYSQRIEPESGLNHGLWSWLGAYWLGRDQGTASKHTSCSYRRVYIYIYIHMCSDIYLDARIAKCMLKDI